MTFANCEYEGLNLLKGKSYGGFHHDDSSRTTRVDLQKHGKILVKSNGRSECSYIGLAGFLFRKMS